MANSLISIRLAPNMQEQLNELTQERGYLSPQELVRDLIRKELLQKEAINIVKLNAGFAKNKKIPTKKEMTAKVISHFNKSNLKN